MAYQVMQDPEGDYYILCDKYAPNFMLILWSEGMYVGVECGPDDILELHACPELSPSLLALEWVRKPCTWEALNILTPCHKAKLPGTLPPVKEYVKKEFKLSEAKVTFNTISLADLCKEHGWEPATCRRILRKSGLQPKGRWEWEKAEVNAVIQIISGELKSAR